MTKIERRIPPDTDIRKYLLSLKPAKRARAIRLLGEEQVASFERDWTTWRHGGQKEPPEGWRIWVIKAGRGHGKTRAGAEWVRKLVDAHCNLSIALVAATLDEARKVMVEGRSGILEIADYCIDDWISSQGIVKFKGGSQARLFSGASPEILRGPEHHFAWCDELAKWEKPGDTWDMLQFGMRLGANPRVLVTTTPKAGSVLTRIMAADDTVVTEGKTRQNPHLPKAFIAHVEREYAGTRLGRQELDGELLPDVAGALWSVELLERCRVDLPGISTSLDANGKGEDAPPAPSAPDAPLVPFVSSEVETPISHAPPTFTRTVIGVDPPSGDGTCGIVACAIDADGIGHVLADHSVSACSPERWASAVAYAAEIHGAQMVVAETNQGGRMVESTLHGADAKLRVKSVTADMSKSDRATPVSMRFEAGKVRLHGRFEELEAELCGMIAGGGYDGPGRSPDRADAMVWALSELMLGKRRAPPRISVL